MVKINSVSNPSWSDSTKSRVDCYITVEHLGDEVIPFTACSGDIEPHGRQLFQELVDGKYGPIGDYVPPIVLQPVVEGANTL